MSSTEQIRNDIDQHRAELADTVEALASKLDVKARATEKIAPAKPYALPAAGVLAALIAALLIVKRRRS